MEKYTVIAPVLYRGLIVESGEIELTDEQAERLLELGVIDAVNDGLSNEVVQLRERGKELGIPRASQMGEVKLREAIAAKEAEQQKQEQEKQLEILREQAIALGIENVDEKDAETLAADIAASQQ